MSDGVRIVVRNMGEVQRRLQSLGQATRGAVVTNALHAAGLVVASRAKQNAPVLTGNLRRSIHTEVKGLQALIGTDVEYACVYGSNTLVVTDKGGKRIAAVEAGDMVLTQAGDFQPVRRTFKFPIAKKPDLVTIEAYWRADKNHTITVTADHKVLAWREGRTKWVQAGDLRASDRLFKRRKLAYNYKGGYQYPERVCKHCGATYRRQGRVYCSVECRNLHWAAGHNPHIGMKRSAEARQRMSEVKKEALARNPELSPNRILAQRGFKTSHEREVAEWLDGRMVPYKEQFKIGRHFVDFYVPDHHLVIEADGAYWHRSQEDDLARDRELIRDLPGVRVWHIHFHDPRFSPKDIVARPLPGVQYVVCNPGPRSFVDLDQFHYADIVSLRPWRWQPHNPDNLRESKPYLYDLEVEGVHSFVANGLLISNSYVETGTSRMGPQPYLRPALESERTRAVQIIGAAIKSQLEAMGR